MMKSWLVAMIVLAIATGPAVAQTSPSGAIGGPLSPGLPPSSVTTSNGPGLVTGTTGSAQMIMIPGSAVPGTLIDNGNGTSTLLIPGGVSQVLPTPR